MKETNHIENVFKLNWPYIMFLNVIVGVAIGFMCWAITSPMLNETQKIQHINHGWNWFNILLLDFAFVACFVSLLIKSYFDFHTTYDNYEIRRPSLTGLKVILWQDVQEVRQVHFGIHLISPSTTIVLSPFVYREPQKVLDVVAHYVFKYKN